MKSEYIEEIKRNLLPEHTHMFLIILCSFLPLFVVSSWSFIHTDSIRKTDDHTKTAQKITNSYGMQFIFIKSGDFQMGASRDELESDNDEMQRNVTLTKGFYLQATEVTQRQWKAIMGNNPSKFSNCGDDCPVENVSWDDVQDFIKKLNRLDSLNKYRLPTEAEWEYACRAGTDSTFHFGICLSTDQANYNGNYPMSGCQKGQTRKGTVPVSSFEPNAWGLYDMHGNVWEWCQDWYGEYKPDRVTNPVGPSSGSYRVRRGGSWKHEARQCRSAARSRHAPSFKGHTVGFRLVRQF